MRRVDFENIYLRVIGTLIGEEKELRTEPAIEGEVCHGVFKPLLLKMVKYDLHLATK